MIRRRWPVRPLQADPGRAPWCCQATTARRHGDALAALTAQHHTTTSSTSTTASCPPLWHPPFAPSPACAAPVADSARRPRARPRPPPRCSPPWPTTPPSRGSRTCPRNGFRKPAPPPSAPPPTQRAACLACATRRAHYPTCLSAPPPRTCGHPSSALPWPSAAPAPPTRRLRRPSTRHTPRTAPRHRPSRAPSWAMAPLLTTPSPVRPPRARHHTTRPSGGGA